MSTGSDVREVTRRDAAGNRCGRRHALDHVVRHQLPADARQGGPDAGPALLQREQPRRRQRRQRGPLRVRVQPARRTALAASLVLPRQQRA